ncbi:MAG: hypothetical protein PsegKO_36360 [Pseudohongiellaceae bacterium]
MTDFTMRDVEDRLEEAAYVLKRLPEERVGGFFSTWPTIIPEFYDLIGRKPREFRAPPPSTAAVTRTEEVLDEWLKLIEPEDRKLVWMRAENAPWKAICYRFGISRATAHRRWQYAIALMAWKLNGNGPASRIAKQKLVKRMQDLERGL